MPQRFVSTYIYQSSAKIPSDESPIPLFTQSKNVRMKQSYIFYACAIMICTQSTSAQNIGIGTTTPQSRLHIVDGASGYVGGYFPGLTFEGSGNRYLNVITPNANETGLLFGNVSSAAHGGIVYNNSSTLSGLQFRTNGNNTRMVIDANGNVGIGNTTPGFPLNFANSLGDKISLWGGSGAHYGLGVQSLLLQIHTDSPTADIAFGYGSSASFTETMRMQGNGIIRFPPNIAKKIILYPGGTGDAGFGVFGNELRIASDYSGADITFGYDDRNAGFTERFRMRGNGSVQISGSAGNAGQMLTSTGGSTPVEWRSPTKVVYDNTVMKIQTTSLTLMTSLGSVQVPGVTHTFTAPANMKIIVDFHFIGAAGSCALCNATAFFMQLMLDGAEQARFTDNVPNGGSMNYSSSYMLSVTPGTHTINFLVFSIGPNMSVLGDTYVDKGRMILLMIPE
jgi:hypothetical protein